MHYQIAMSIPFDKCAPTINASVAKLRQRFFIVNRTFAFVYQKDRTDTLYHFKEMVRQTGPMWGWITTTHHLWDFFKEYLNASFVVTEKLFTWLVPETPLTYTTYHYRAMEKFGRDDIGHFNILFEFKFQLRTIQPPSHHKNSLGTIMCETRLSSCRILGMVLQEKEDSRFYNATKLKLQLPDDADMSECDLGHDCETIPEAIRLMNEDKYKVVATHFQIRDEMVLAPASSLY